MILLENKVAVVTGSSRGIGFAIIENFLENGAKVAILTYWEEQQARLSRNLLKCTIRKCLWTNGQNSPIRKVCIVCKLNRIGEPEEVAKAVLFLASDLASYVSGEILYCDGQLLCNFFKQNKRAAWINPCLLFFLYLLLNFHIKLFWITFYFLISLKE